MGTDWDEFIDTTDLDLSDFNIIKEDAVIRKVGKEWCVFSEDGKRLGCYDSRKKAEERLQQIEYWKHKKGSTLVVSKQECYCRQCGSYFLTKGNKMCYNSSCPYCGEQDDLIEVTGEL